MRHPMADERMHEECGLFGIDAPGDDVANLTYFGLYALQHRGQESAGIATSDGRVMRMHKDMGLVAQAFDQASLEGLTGHLALGHTRYSTTGSNRLENAQPIMVEHPQLGRIAIAHNGNLTNTQALRDDLLHQGVRFKTERHRGPRGAGRAHERRRHPVRLAPRAAAVAGRLLPLVPHERRAGRRS